MNPWRDLFDAMWNNGAWLALTVFVVLAVVFALGFGVRYQQRRWDECRSHGFTVNYCGF